MATRLEMQAWVRTEEPLMWLLGANVETRTSPAYRFDCRTRPDTPHIVLQLVLSGEHFYESVRDAPAHRQILRPGTAFLERIPGPFRYGWHSGVARHAYVSLRGQQADEWFSRVVAGHGHILHLDTESAPAHALVAIARLHQDHLLLDRYAASARLYDLWMNLLSHLQRTSLTADTRVSVALHQLQQRAPDPHFRLANLTTNPPCSREHLSRQFRQTVGVSPAEYLLQHRLNLAAAHLRSRPPKAGPLTLEHIASLAGFNSANYLCRQFKKHFGLTPTEFRDRPWS